MKKPVLSFQIAFAMLLVCVSSRSVAQNILTYRLDGTFASTNPLAPALVPIGAGQFELDSLIELDSLQRQSYHFNLNSGLVWTDSTDFLGQSYTIEMYFKFENLSSWKRIIDYKNRTTDRGLYAKDARINFYNITLSGEAPFVVNEYAHVVVTRDTLLGKPYVIYVDGDSITAFNDTNNDGVIGVDGLLTFFRDDVLVPNEASAGNVALIRLFDFTLSTHDVDSLYGELLGTVTPTGLSPAGISSQVGLYPNPVRQTLYLSYPSQVITRFVLTDYQGRTVRHEQGHDLREVSMEGLASGLYQATLYGLQGMLGSQKIRVE